MFKKVLNALYLDRNLKHQFCNCLLHIKHIKSVINYSIEFQEIIIPLKFDDNVKCLLFYMSLKNSVKDVLTIIDEEETFMHLINQVIIINQRQYQHHLNEKRFSSKFHDFKSQVFKNSESSFSFKQFAVKSNNNKRSTLHDFKSNNHNNFNSDIDINFNNSHAFIINQKRKRH
jgi:hypothetical protein